MHQANVNILPHWELEKLVKETWQEKDCFNAIAEFIWANDCAYYHPDMKGEPFEDLQKWLDDELMFGASSSEVINSLIAAGKLQQGNYLIQVSW